MIDLLEHKHSSLNRRSLKVGSSKLGLRYDQKLIFYNPKGTKYYQQVHGHFLSQHQRRYLNSQRALNSPKLSIGLNLADLIFTSNIVIVLILIHFIFVNSLGFTFFIIDSESPFVPHSLYSEFTQGTSPVQISETIPVEIESSQFESLELDSYTLEAGDTLSGIADRFNLVMDTIISFNQIENARRIQIGQTFQIPNRDGLLHIVEAGESLRSISNEYGSDFNAILDANSLFTEEIAPGQAIFIPNAQLDRTTLGLILGELFIYPTYGTFTSGFGYRSDPFTGERRFHYGIDIANARGTNIRAAMDGRVVYVDSIGRTNYGKYVIMQHAGGFQSLYAHFHDISVQRGQYIYQGGVLGGMGTTGRSTGDHLHFSIIRNGTFVDPLAYLQ